MQKLVIEINNAYFMILQNLVRFRYSLISVLGVIMRQNMAKGPRSVSVMFCRVGGSLL